MRLTPELIINEPTKTMLGFQHPILIIQPGWKPNKDTLRRVRVTWFNQGILKGENHCTVDLLFDWFGISCMATNIFCFYLQNRLIQPVKQEVTGTVILPPLVFPGFNSLEKVRLADSQKYHLFTSINLVLQPMLIGASTRGAAFSLRLKHKRFKVIFFERCIYTGRFLWNISKF